MEDGNAGLQCCQDVCQRLAVGVVEVAGYARGVYDARHRRHHFAHALGRAHADGVGHVDLVDLHRQVALRHVYHRFDRDFALVRAAQRAADAAAHADAGLAGGLHHGFETRDGFRDRTVDVLLREGLAGGAEDHDLVGPGRKRALEALHVGRQHGIDRAGAALDARHDVRAVGHLWHPFGRYERCGLDIREAGGAEPVDQFHLDVGRHEFLFVLQAIAGRHLDDLYAGGQSHVSSCFGMG
ncbi:hypothetical protein D9M68_586940 [compost metagenome]